MCGRYNFSIEEAELREILDEVQANLNKPIKTGEIYPTNIVPVLMAGESAPKPTAMTWGFPHFKGSGVIINARAETVTDKKMFRESVLSRRCLIPANGFFEWKKEEGSKKKTKLFFQQPDSNIMYMAGFYNTFRKEQGPEERFVMLTTQANDSMLDDDMELSLFPSDQGERKLIHDRMPIILQPEERAEWLSPSANFEKLFNREKVVLDHSYSEKSKSEVN